MSITNQELQTTITPLRLIFWGGLICFFDVTVKGEGWKFDIINDLVGMLMITWGVYQLRKIALHDRYRAAMLFAAVIATISCIVVLHSHFIYEPPAFVSFLLSVHGVMAMAATVVFCVAMRWLCSDAGLLRSARSWKTTILLFVFIYLLPLALLYCTSFFSDNEPLIATETYFNLAANLVDLTDPRPAFLLLLAVFFIPIIHLFVSISRMKADAESMANMGQQGVAPNT